MPAYEMRISDWSSDVCSSDLVRMASTTPGVEVTAASASGSAPAPALAPSPSRGGLGWGWVSAPAPNRSTRVPCTCLSQRSGDGRPARSISSARLRATTAGSSPSAARALPRLKVSNGGCELPAPERSVVNACTPGAASQSARSRNRSESLSRVLEPLSCLRERGWGVGRSEEHTSELQSLMRISYDVFGLQKNKNINTQT